MAKLSLIRDTRELERHALSRWRREVGEGKPPSCTVRLLPCLGKVEIVRHTFFIESIDVLIVTCSKDEAKRIIYPKTNKNRSRYGFFVVIEGQNLMATMDEYIRRTIRLSDARLDFGNPVQRMLVDRAISDLDGASGLALVTTKVYTTTDGLRLMNFYTVDELAARELVYLNKGPSNKLKKLYPELKYHRSVERHIQELKSSFNRFTREYEIMHHNNPE